MERLITKEIVKWYKDCNKKSLLVDGARQTGKTYIIEAFGEKYCESFVELNLLWLSDEQLKQFSKIHSTEQLISFISAVCGKSPIPGKTVIFLDEVQASLNFLTIVKFLAEDDRFRYILSGSLLGIEESNVKSMPVGYMRILHMYPMNFKEFCLACGVQQSTLDELERHFVEESEIEDYMDEVFSELYKCYLIVGGMPQAVQKYVDTSDFTQVREIQKDICEIYRVDISKYDKKNKPLIINVFNQIPAELNTQNKRFKFSSLSEGRKTRSIYAENAFLWLSDAGIAIPVYCASEPKYPLIISKSRNLLKLFLGDVGLLASMYMDDDSETQSRILTGESNINFGAIFENAICQELTSNGFTPYYYNSKKFGELDLLIQLKGKAVPIEIKSGKTYNRHSALCNVLGDATYDIDTAYVFVNKNIVKRDGKKVYMPVYMSMFLQKTEPTENVHKIDLSRLGGSEHSS
ncbi:MAG: AAA family ATPase [Clostridia bacterium]|nr:AAA family ATPase [Clostridia bacterium]